MSDYKHIDLQAECLNLQNIIADLIHLKGKELTPEEERALTVARRWLGDITNPLTTGETEKWAEEGEELVRESLRGADPWSWNNSMNDADRRDALEYMSEEE